MIMIKAKSNVILKTVEYAGKEVEEIKCGKTYLVGQIYRNDYNKPGMYSCSIDSDDGEHAYNIYYDTIEESDNILDNIVYVTDITMMY